MPQYIELSFDKVVTETKLAIGFDMGTGEVVFIPKKCIDMDSYDPEDKEVPVVEWFAILAELV